MLRKTLMGSRSKAQIPSSRWLSALALSACVFTAPVSAYYVFDLPDPDTNAVLYGDGFSYSGPILDYSYPDGNGSVYIHPANGNISPFAFSDTIAGKVDDELNVASSNNGQEVSNQPDGTEEAYLAEGGQSGSADFFSTTELFRDPANKSGLIADDLNAWDANLAVFADAYLNADGELQFAPVFVFNNNEENDQASQTLEVWGQVFLWDSTGVQDPIVLTLQNSCVASFSTQICFAGGEILGDDPTGAEDGMRGGFLLPGVEKDPTLFSQVKANNDYPETDWDNGLLPADVPVPDDFVISGGDVCFSGANATGNLQECDGTEGTKVVHNLGADRISYMVYFPELADLLRDYGMDGSQTAGYDMISTDLRMGCNSAFNDVDCLESQVIDNGQERAFWSRTRVEGVALIPEPSAIALLGIGMLGVGFARARSRRKRI